jgi:glycosyltransferase involved in cell wall biosynthesis
MQKETLRAVPASSAIGLLDMLHEIRPDLPKPVIAGLIIDESAYYRDNKDVQRAGVPAARHYFQYGEKEKRKYSHPKISFSKTLSSDPVKQGKVVYYTSATDDNPSWLYRCVFPFKKSEFSTDHIFFSGTNLLSRLILGVFTAKKVVFMRPIYTTTTIYLVQLCRRIGVEVEFDYDDLLLPEYARQRGACRSGLRPHKDDFSESLKQSSLTMQADSFTCSTKPIAFELKKINSNVSVRLNKLPKSMFMDEKDILQRAKERTAAGGKLKILYLSGSNTHKRDFSTIVGPLTKIAQEFPDRFSVTFMGSLSDYSSVFNMIGVESFMKPTVPFQQMLEIIGQHDLVLVPLEFSVFNHCKSNIKYIESASQGVPVIASSVTEFSASIKHGVNGWLCDDEHQWYETLKDLATNPAEAFSCGISAFRHAKKEFSV